MEKHREITKGILLIVIIRTMKQLIFIQDYKGDIDCLPRWDSVFPQDSIGLQVIFPNCGGCGTESKNLKFYE